jgi:mRNA interferase RelE/StbE
MEASDAYQGRYDVTGATVQILAIVAKSEAESWLAQFASPE